MHLTLQFNQTNVMINWFGFIFIPDLWNPGFQIFLEGKNHAESTTIVGLATFSSNHTVIIIVGEAFSKI